uniref:Uncharacterized protein n=1 Tax=viral metagenome TaxID=1070528 RepID=A0A6C0H789_9ZZZZ
MYAFLFYYDLWKLLLFLLLKPDIKSPIFSSFNSFFNLELSQAADPIIILLLLLHNNGFVIVKFFI